MSLGPLLQPDRQSGSDNIPMALPLPLIMWTIPALKSLTLTLPVATLSEFLDLICSFPLLEDLSMLSPRFHAEGTDELDTPPTSPKFTGSLS